MELCRRCQAPLKKDEKERCSVCEAFVHPPKTQALKKRKVA